MIRLSPAQFEAAVAEAIDQLPPEIAAAIENVAITIEEEPSDDDLEALGMNPDDETLFGLYQGQALTERGVTGYSGILPDRIVIYRQPLLEACRSRRELLREIHDTVVHEIGHYFGLDEEDLP